MLPSFVMCWGWDYHPPLSKHWDWDESDAVARQLCRVFDKISRKLLKLKALDGQKASKTVRYDVE